jgi:signal transduction histidine kinase
VDVHLQEFNQGGRAAFLAVILDITERKAAERGRELLEAQLRQAGKMEAVGRLAGGVAHDFNNMLNVILGHTELAQQATSASDRVRRNLEEIGAAARRSADLTRQLLAFSRQQPIAPRALDLNDQVGRIEQLLRRLIGEDIDLELSPAEDLWPVSLDPSQVDQVLANLCINARDAMPNGGRLQVETGNVVPTESHLRRHPDVVPGEFVVLSVTDTGCGMSEKVMERAFEPFFTTKPEGQGTGLGLATVYGIAKQNGGFVEMRSTPGRGTTVSLFLPRCRTASDSDLRGSKGVSAEAGSGTILLVEDEPQLLELTGEMLERLGYHVLKAGSPEDALTLAASRPGGIDLVLTDVVMPAMNGRELTARLRTDEPDLKVLYMSGYPADTVAPRGVLRPGVAFIGKPFSLDALARKVREVLRSE